MTSIHTSLQKPHIPEFRDFAKWDQARNLRLDFNKLKLEVILDSQSELPFKKNLLIEWKYALIITYDWIWGYVLSFDESENGSLIVKQIQWVKSKVSYKVSTSIDAVWFYLDFFKKNIVWQVSRVEVSENPNWLENIWDFIKKDPFFEYMFFQKRLNTILANN